MRHWLCIWMMVCAAMAAPFRTLADPTPPAALSKVVAALDNIRALTRPGKDGYATIWDGNKYVQCRGGPQLPLRCEAAGTLMQPSLESVLTPEHIKQLAALGWRLDPSYGNYVQTFPAKTSSDGVAQALLAALTQGYDANLDGLEFETAWVDSQPCPPRNGPTQNLAGMIDDAPEMAAVTIRTCSYTPDPAGMMDAPVASADALVARDGAKVAAEIMRLRINATKQVFVAFDSGIGYVQCAPEAAPAGIYCEAQSAQSWAALSSVLTPDRVARLHAAGYADPGRSPNYAKTYAASEYDDAAIARQLLTILYEVYGYTGQAPISVTTEMSR